MNLHALLDSPPEPPVLRPEIGASANTSGDYGLLTPMLDFQMELTDQIVTLHYLDILKLAELQLLASQPDQYLLDSARTMHVNLALVATHPYLLIEDYMPKSLVAKDMPQKVRDTSGKFGVLGDMFALLQNTTLPLNVGVAALAKKPATGAKVQPVDHTTETKRTARGGARNANYGPHDLLEALLMGYKANIKRHHGTNLKDALKNKKTHSLTAHILPPVCDRKLAAALPPLDLLVVVDTSVDVASYTKGRSPGRSAPPVVRLVPANLVEHVVVLSCPSKYYEPVLTTNQLQAITNAVVVLRDQVGVIPPDLRPIFSTHLQFLADWLAAPAAAPWPLPDLPPLRDYSNQEMQRALMTEVKFHFSYPDDEPRETSDAPAADVAWLAAYYQPHHTPEAHDQQRGLYASKRLKRDYMSNPLNLLLELLGIKYSANHPLLVGPDMLTHRTMYELVRASRANELARGELELLQGSAPRRNLVREFSADQVGGAEALLREQEDKVAAAVAAVAANEVRMSEAREKSTEASVEIDKLAETTDDPEVVRRVEQDRLEQIVADLRRRLATLEQEGAYIQDEITKAEQVVEELQRAGSGAATGEPSATGSGAATGEPSAVVGVKGAQEAAPDVPGIAVTAATVASTTDATALAAENARLAERMGQQLRVLVRRS